MVAVIKREKAKWGFCPFFFVVSVLAHNSIKGLSVYHFSFKSLSWYHNFILFIYWTCHLWFCCHFVCMVGGGGGRREGEERHMIYLGFVCYVLCLLECVKKKKRSIIWKIIYVRKMGGFFLCSWVKIHCFSHFWFYGNNLWNHFWAEAYECVFWKLSYVFWKLSFDDICACSYFVINFNFDWSLCGQSPMLECFAIKCTWSLKCSLNKYTIFFSGFADNCDKSNLPCLGVATTENIIDAQVYRQNVLIR